MPRKKKQSGGETDAADAALTNELFQPLPPQQQPPQQQPPQQQRQQPLRQQSSLDSTLTENSYYDDDSLYQTQDYLDALEDVHTRFILNLPESELQTADRIFFQIEQAWWYYEDWICDPQQNPNLPRFANFRPFAQRLFAYSPLLPDGSKRFNSMWNEFSKYKQKIGNYGCILLNAACDKVILARVWNSTTYTFPAGKINQGEDGALAAARETYEETGFDASCTLGLTAQWKKTQPQKITWPAFPSHDDKDALVHQEDNGKRRTAYVVVGVPMDFPFEPVARKEVSAVEWHDISQIPKPSYGVVPFMGQLKRWIKKYKAKKGSRSKSKSPKRGGGGKKSTERGGGRKNTPSRSRSSRERGRRQTPDRQTVDSSEDPLVTSGLVQEGELSGWSEEEMFETNERILGRKVEYDGNPHDFVDEGLKKDPHKFRVVGGGFLNADRGGIESLAPPPPESRLQPLFRKEEPDSTQDSTADGPALQPFFSQEGETPWGEVVKEAKGDAVPPPRLAEGFSFGTRASEPLLSDQSESSRGKDPVKDDDNIDFLTDAQITAKSQSEKMAAWQRDESSVDKFQRERQHQYEQDMKFVHQWVANLPKPTPTKHFGEWKLDTDALLAGTPLMMATSTSEQKR